MLPDAWLARWLPQIHAHAPDGRVLEIGCGPGDDTATLAAGGLSVLALDLSPAAAAAVRLRVPQALVVCQDVRDPWPAQARDLGVVLASLSLHYFDDAQTAILVARVRQALRPGGLLLCRLNSSDDRNFGATGPGWYPVHGQPKRFFDEAAVRALFGQGWRRLALEHRHTHKYGLRKALWELAAEREG